MKHGKLMLNRISIGIVCCLLLIGCKQKQSSESELSSIKLNEIDSKGIMFTNVTLQFSQPEKESVQFKFKKDEIVQAKVVSGTYTIQLLLYNGEDIALSSDRGVCKSPVYTLLPAQNEVSIDLCSSDADKITTVGTFNGDASVSVNAEKTELLNIISLDCDELLIEKVEGKEGLKFTHPVYSSGNRTFFLYPPGKIISKTDDSIKAVFKIRSFETTDLSRETDDYRHSYMHLELSMINGQFNNTGSSTLFGDRNKDGVITDEENLYVEQNISSRPLGKCTKLEAELGS